MPSKRRLAVIMFTDVVGYTSLMGEDEEMALNLLRKNKEIHHRLLKQYDGRFLKEMGDGILSSLVKKIRKTSLTAYRMREIRRWD
jgi:adenylate cyclase